MSNQLYGYTLHSTQCSRVRSILETGLQVHPGRTSYKLKIKHNAEGHISNKEIDLKESKGSPKRKVSKF